MNTKFRRSVWMSAVVAALMVVSFGVVGAQDDDEIILPSFSDERVNNFDLAAPVAVYCAYDYPDDDDPDAGVLESIELWGLTGAEDDLFHEVAVVSAESIAAAQSAVSQPMMLAQSYGYTLWLLDSDTLQVVAPADFEGKVYDFSWDLGTTVRC